MQKAGFIFKIMAFLACLGVSPLSMLQAQVGDTSSDARPISNIFVLNQNDTPSFWGLPIAADYYDETGKHDRAANDAMSLAGIYGYISGTSRPVSEASLPNIGYVIAEDRFDSENDGPLLTLAPNLIERLLRKWRDTPLEAALYNSEMRSAFMNVRDGTDCSVFAHGVQVDEGVSYFVFSSAVVVANSELSEKEISLCFHNKTALVFGLATNNFDGEKHAFLNSNPPDYDWLLTAYYGIYPAALQAWATCRGVLQLPTLECTQDVFASSTELLSSITRNENDWGIFFRFRSGGRDLARRISVDMRNQAIDQVDGVLLSNATNLAEFYSRSMGSYNPFGDLPQTPPTENLLLEIRNYSIKNGAILLANEEKNNGNEEFLEKFRLSDEGAESDEKKCVFLTGLEDDNGSNFSAILAHSSLSYIEKELCFRNKMSVYFQLYANGFSHDLKVPFHISNSAIFHINPLTLRGASSCIQENGDLQISCVAASIQEITSTLLSSL